MKQGCNRCCLYFFDEKNLKAVRETKQLGRILSQADHFFTKRIFLSQQQEHQTRRNKGITTITRDHSSSSRKARYHHHVVQPDERDANIQIMHHKSMGSHTTTGEEHNDNEMFLS